MDVVIVGAGPAGLTAAYKLIGRPVHTTVVESDTVVGGISRTVQWDGWRMDIGGHRFFTKVPEVEALWREILAGEGEFLERPRMSRIYYERKFLEYPIQVFDVMRKLGLVEFTRCALSLVWAKVRPPEDRTSYEGVMVRRFGWRLYRKFFKSYTEKVWGVPADEIQGDWAVQRVKDLSLVKAVLNSVMPRRGTKQITSLIERFHYPRLGPGMMWERAAEMVEAAGTAVRMERQVRTFERSDGGVHAVEVIGPGGRETLRADQVISSMPLADLVLAMDPPAPPEVQVAAKDLRYRDHMTIGLIVPEEDGFPDNWIYVHYPGVRVGRIQNFRSWSPDMVKPGRTCLGMEYFVFEGDDLWAMEDEDLVRLATKELAEIGLVDAGAVESGHVERMRRAYPMYDEHYHDNVGVIREWLAAAVPNVQVVGRNGMHRYNNQDHSMYTAMLAVENLFGAHHDLWSVNVEAVYLEEHAEEPEAVRRRGTGTGRGAPVLPAGRL